MDHDVIAKNVLYREQKKNILTQNKSVCLICIVSHFNPLNAQLNPICPLLPLLGAHHILHVSRIRVKILKSKRIHGFK
jgi:hypothetical protein